MSALFVLYPDNKARWYCADGHLHIGTAEVEVDGEEGRQHQIQPCLVFPGGMLMIDPCCVVEGLLGELVYDPRASAPHCTPVQDWLAKNPDWPENRDSIEWIDVDHYMGLAASPDHIAQIKGRRVGRGAFVFDPYDR